SGTRSARIPDTLPTKIAEHKTRSQTHSETISYSFALGFRAEPMNPQEPTVRNPRFRFVLSLGVVPGRDQGPQSQFPQGLPVPAGRCVEQITPGAAVERITALGRPL
ncbi:hypothetical protein ACH4OH_23700, partial [Streptomyces albidoflavus]